MEKEYQKMIEVAESLGWSVRIDKNEFTFSKFSPSGQDFNMEFAADDVYDVIAEIKDRVNNFDCSEETYLWLDDTGHGKNGAPYDMKDLYEDMEACLKMIEELCNTLETTEFEETEEE